MDKKCSPCVFPEAKGQLFARHRNCLVSTYRGITLALAQLRKTKPVKFLSVRKDSFVLVSSTRWNGDECACGDSHAIGKRERAQRETAHDHWRKDKRIHQEFTLRMLGRGNATNRFLNRQAAVSPARNCLSCAFCPLRLLSTLLLQPQPQPLGEGVQYIQDWQGDDTILAKMSSV